MSTRPEILFPLFGEVINLPGVGPRTIKLFEMLDIARLRDLILTLPNSGIDRKIRHSIRGIVAPEIVTVEVEVGAHHPNSSKTQPYRVLVEDAQSSFSLVFFHPRPDWLKNMLPTGQRRIISGRVEIFDGIAQMVHPDHILPVERAAEIPAFEPVYPLTAGLTQKVMSRAVRAAIDRAPKLPEWIEPTLKLKSDWPDWKDALDQAHAPSSMLDISPFAKARERLAYDELFAHQLTLALARSKLKRSPGIASVQTKAIQTKVLKKLPYLPTSAQTTAIAEIAHDLAAPVRMNRLLQGDVGSGKTLVALMSLLIAVEAGGQGVMMAPTEILARQHLENLRPLLEHSDVSVEILTGRDKGTERAKKLESLACGDIQILLGTHAVFQEDVVFKDLRLAVIDEQHRFGVRQRMYLGQKGHAVDVLVMTATPIPRSLALAQYGDMDVSILDEKPPGRMPVKTVVLPAGRIDEVVDHLRQSIADGVQAYWVCPLVNESETVEWTAAAERHRALCSSLGSEHVGLVHGQMPTAQKDAAMAEFVAGRISILVATTVIEVGVDVANASIMVIEQAENFGLAQLHQLRGRVGRGTTQSSCLLIYRPPLGVTAHRRLTAMRQSDDGFALSEVDLKLRGAGDMIGVEQSGLPKFRIADIETQPDLMKTAQDDARLLLVCDPDFTSARGKAARTLLYLMEQEKVIQMITIG
ncbi:MAG: ATP-dependent DNA helicase RecG [Alphaproteobacteria bacterium]|nr:ATP-dependent DNA helicase RecG [Alphaproteobacteria bacterium]